LINAFQRKSPSVSFSLAPKLSTNVLLFEVEAKKVILPASSLAWRPFPSLYYCGNRFMRTSRLLVIDIAYLSLFRASLVGYSGGSEEFEVNSFLDLLSNLLERATSAFADIVLAVSLYCTQKTSEPPDLFFCLRALIGTAACINYTILLTADASVEERRLAILMAACRLQ
jgi:hypothetical protein